GRRASPQGRAPRRDGRPRRSRSASPGGAGVVAAAGPVGPETAAEVPAAGGAEILCPLLDQQSGGFLVVPHWTKMRLYAGPAHRTTSAFAPPPTCVVTPGRPSTHTEVGTLPRSAGSPAPTRTSTARSAGRTSRATGTPTTARCACGRATSTSTPATGPRRAGG